MVDEELNFYLAVRFSLEFQPREKSLVRDLQDPAKEKEKRGGSVPEGYPEVIID